MRWVSSPICSNALMRLHTASIGITGEDRQAVQVSPDEEVTTEDAEVEEDETSIEEEGASATDSRALVIDLLSYAFGNHSSTTVVSTCLSSH